MRSKDPALREILEYSRRYVIPEYQRFYEWTQEKWVRLWDSFEKLEKRTKLRPTIRHYMGAIVGYEDKDRPLDWMTIDGQQRLVTLCLVFAAIRDETSDIDLAETIESRYLRNSERQYKVKPRGAGGPAPNDQVAFEKVMLYRKRKHEVGGETALQEIPRGQILEGYKFFRSKVQRLEQSTPERVTQLASLLLRNLSLTEITLDEDDDPHSIFETLNDTGLKITPASCLRNFFFLKTLGSEAGAVSERWQPIETLFRSIQKNGKRQRGKDKDRHREDPLTDFCHHYVMMLEQRYFPEDQLYFEVQTLVNNRIAERIKTTSSMEEASLGVILDFLHEMGIAASAYTKIKYNPKEETDREIRDRLEVIHEIEESPSVPLRLSACVRYEKEELSKAELLEVLDALENFLIRRHVCGTRSKNGGEETKFMPTLCGLSPSEVRKRLARVSYPSDRQFSEALLTANIGGGMNKRIGVILNKRWEEHGRDIIPMDSVDNTLEHILPQQEDVVVWRLDLGEEYAEAMKSLHTLGNTCLLLREDNSRSGVKAFADKRVIYAESRHESARLVAGYSKWGLASLREVARIKIEDLLKTTWPHLDPTKEKEQSERVEEKVAQHLERQSTRDMFDQIDALCEVEAL